MQIGVGLGSWEQGGGEGRVAGMGKLAPGRARVDRHTTDKTSAGAFRQTRPFQWIYYRFLTYACAHAHARAWPTPACFVHFFLLACFVVALLPRNAPLRGLRCLPQQMRAGLRAWRMDAWRYGVWRTRCLGHRTDMVFFFRRDLGSMRMNWQISLADVRRS